MIDRDTVRHIATLSRLELSDELTGKFATEMSAILDYFGELEKIDTKNVQPLLSPNEIALHVREDIAEGSLDPEATTANAPGKVGNLFRVPAVV
ncbi:MAG: Asp-tRNA(Asn)/Glu-tRNA(Gln) amidotransferase subunit GatC [Bdellovibrionales bacterium]|nr:Asp-tRNA(Asn)/Glu-tRNA(Gln) amidotransferase subunit GatC [Bdellovibrionales bacterium]